MVALAALLAAQTVSVASLLREMADLDRLAQPNTAGYECAQASSYDRKSKTPGNDDWLANADWGQYIRQEGNEWVMADLKGPGAVQRVWSANPQGTIRFYFDGEAKPRIEAPMADLLQGKGLFSEPFSYNSARGCNLYFPLPYAKSLKVTVEGPNSNRIYYHVGYRTYPTGTAVETFHPSDIPPLGRYAAALSGPPRPGAMRSHTGSETLTGAGVVKEFAVRIPPDAIANPSVYSSLELKVTVDGKVTIWTPFYAFFASPVGPKSFESMPISVDANKGVFTSRFRMPFARSYKVEVVNRSRTFVPISVESKWVSGEASPLRFVAQYGSDPLPSRPMRDLDVLDVTGESGRFVGFALHVENPNNGWWGEGDEKIWADGDAFPRFFGTGSEDYFSYAWSNPELFQRPYHGQPRSDGPANFGHISNFRWHIFDDIPYRNHFKFVMEAWHWADCDARWKWVSYRYADASTFKAVAAPPLAIPRTLLPSPPVKGALEGEDLAILEKSGGTTEVQGFGDLSSGKQLWWRDAKVGDRIVFEVPIKQSGTYRVKMNLCTARDYGRHQLVLNGRDLGEIDFYNKDLKWGVRSFGPISLKAGKVKLEVITRTPNPGAEPRNMFGLDYIRLVK